MDRAIPFSIADRVRDLAGSPTVSVMDAARKLKAAGQPVVDLSGGDPDFVTAPHVTEAAIAALNQGFTHYTPSRGIPELLRAIARKTLAENGADFDPKKEIIVTPGAKLALFTAAQTLLNPGDEVILFDPCWVSYAPCVELAGAKAVYVTVTPETTPAELRARIEAAASPRTRLCILNSPNNPTGQVWTLEQLQVVADAAQAYGILVLSDEIYEKLIFDGRKHISIASLPGMRERTLVMNGLSKSHAMTGWRLGWIAGPEAIVSQMLKIHQHSSTCAPSFVQVAAVAALEGSQEYTEYMVSRYARRRDALMSGLNGIPGIVCAAPQGSFYAWPNIAASGLDDMQFTTRLLERELVAVTPGTAFGPGGAGHIRLSFANSDELLAEAVKRITRFAANLR